jgi:hypothetical protein
MRTREEAQEMTERSLAIAALGHVLFSGEEPEVVGAALAEMMSLFLRNHRIVGDERSEREMRHEIFDQWIKTVRDLLLIHEKAPVGMQ